MDSWLVAAAAAGYFAKYCQNLWRDRNSFPESRTGKAETGDPPFCRLARRRKFWEDISSDEREVSARKVSDIYRLNVASAAEVDSASRLGSEKVGSLRHHADHNLISQSSLASGFLTNENLREDQCPKGPCADSCGNSANPSITTMDSFSEPLRKRSSLETKYSYRHLHKPLSSLDSCLMAQLYTQHVKMEECVLASLPSPPTAISRPLLRTDRSKIISGASGGFSNEPN